MTPFTTNYSLLLCDSNVGPSKECSTNATCYYTSVITESGQLVDERFGCGKWGVICVHSEKIIRETITKCCKNVNFCNRALREKAPFEAKDYLNRNGIFNSTSSSFENNFNLWVSLLVVFFLIVVAVCFALIYYRRKICPSGANHLNTEKESGDSTTGAEELSVLKRRTAAMDLHVIRKIGEGSFGRVFVADYKGSNVAVKFFDPTCLASFSLEKHIYEFGAMKNEFVLKCLFTDIKRFEGLNQHVLVTEYCCKGSLREFLSAETIDEWFCYQMAHDIASGLAYLHTEIVVAEFYNGKPAIAHRDLKTSNIFLLQNLRCVIGDFGNSLLNSSLPVKENSLASLFNNLSRSTKTTILANGSYDTCAMSPLLIGTIRYMAPELLNGKINKNDFDAFRQTDMYAFGLILWEIGTRTVIDCQVVQHTLPYLCWTGSQPTGQQMKIIVNDLKHRPEIPDYWKKSEKMLLFKDIMEECWSAKPTSRLTALNCKYRLQTLKYAKDKENF